MSEYYVGEVRLFAFSRIPSGWFACDGSLQSVNNYQLLFTLLGTTFGGDGVTTFGLPDMRGQVPIHQGTGPGLTPRVLGQKGGSETVTLISANMPAHSHPYNVTSAAASASVPTTSLQLATPNNNDKMYTASTTTLTPYLMSPNTNTGGNLPHPNMMPTLPVSFFISWEGIYPTRS